MTVQKEMDRPRWFARLVSLIEGPQFQAFITAAILVNAVTLGLETWDYAVEQVGWLLLGIDQIILAIFVFELTIKLFAYRGRFFLNGWNVFDFIIVAVSLLPAQGDLSVLRALRILRVMRLLSVVPTLRRVVEALLKSLPGMSAIVGVLGLVFYVSAVIATKSFGQAFPEWFGTIGGSMYSLFQIMTLESWSMGIVRPVMETFPLAWIFFVPFVFITSFGVLNLFIAIIVNSMTALQQEELKDAHETAERAHQERDQLLAEIKTLNSEVRTLREAVARVTLHTPKDTS